MATLDELNQRIEKTEKILKGFADFKPGDPARKEYIKNNLGDAESFLGELLIFYRVIRRDVKLDPKSKYLSKSPRKERFLEARQKRQKNRG